MKSLEALERIHDNFGECEIGSHYYDLELSKDYQLVKTDLEVFKIMLNKSIMYSHLFSSNGVEEYNSHLLFKDDYLTAEEYEKIKARLKK